MGRSLLPLQTLRVIAYLRENKGSKVKKKPVWHESLSHSKAQVFIQGYFEQESESQKYQT